MLDTEVCAGRFSLLKCNARYDMIGVGLNQEGSLVAVVKIDIAVLTLPVLIGEDAASGAVFLDLIRARGRKSHDHPIDAFCRSSCQVSIPVGCDLSDACGRFSRTVKTRSSDAIYALESGASARGGERVDCH